MSVSRGIKKKLDRFKAKVRGGSSGKVRLPPEDQLLFDKCDNTIKALNGLVKHFKKYAGKSKSKMHKLDKQMCRLGSGNRFPRPDEMKNALVCLQVAAKSSTTPDIGLEESGGSFYKELTTIQNSQFVKDYAKAKAELKKRMGDVEAEIDTDRNQERLDLAVKDARKVAEGGLDSLAQQFQKAVRNYLKKQAEGHQQVAEAFKDVIKNGVNEDQVNHEEPDGGSDDSDDGEPDDD